MDTIQLSKESLERHLAKAQIRVNRTKARYEALGYKVTVFDVSDWTTVDMIAENDHEVISLEITNWKRECYMDYKRFISIISHWNTHEQKHIKNGDKRLFKRRLVYNYPENIKYYVDAFIMEMSVDLEMVGHNDNPLKKEYENPTIEQIRGLKVRELYEEI